MEFTMIKYIALIALGFVSTTEPSIAQQQKPFSASDLIKMKRVSSPALSPDEKKVAYVIRTTDLDSDRGRTDIWLTDLESKQSLQLTTDPASDHSPTWSTTENKIYFISSRTGTSQVWSLIPNRNNSTKQVTHLPVDVSSFKVAPNGKAIAFTASVYRECKTLSCSVKRTMQQKDSKTTGVVYDKMFVRHWDHWIGKTQSQLFVMPLEAKITEDKIIHVSSPVNANVPSDPFGGSEEYNFSSDSKKVIFSARLQNAQEPTSTNFDLYSVNLDSPNEATNLTISNKAWDTQPIFSSDGKYLAYLAMKRPGFEADKLDLILVDLETSTTTNLTEDWDRSFSSASFSGNNQSIFLTGNNQGTKALWKLDLKSKEVVKFNNDGHIGAISVGQTKLIYAKDNLKNPVQLFSVNTDGTDHQQLTFVNQKELQQLKFGEYEQFSFNGWNGDKVFGYIVKPANFDKSKKYPLAFLIHGGPQGSFGDHFHYRWNPQTYAGQGYVAIMIDFHGSTGYGQAFTDSISQNWGSKPLIDLQKGLSFALKKYPFVDGNKACALGASYGGYMVNWIAGNWQNQFKCLVNHDGVFDNRMMYYTTEELWFVEWENGGSYFEKPKNHERFNPVNYVKNWKTPMLVIQGGKDYRIPETQSLATFTALQKLNIPSKLLYFPDENHWVLGPNNSLQWHNEVNQWLQQYLK
jgi:dipeptidyl aminopeptidase/acylaminoacyl peptidase